MIGKTVGNYRILDRLGRGGMGIVYKALDETLDREVAIKVLNPDLSDADLLKRFRAEAVSLARLNHPGIATIYELRRHDDELLMVMEFVRGETLQTLSERLGPLEPPQAAHVCIQILDALAHAHRAGVIHRDLKPANVMMTHTGVVKVMDFGIARMLGAEHFTHAGFMMGTPAYMAPEQVLGQDIDGRADLYSVGVLFYRLLSRELPFQADTAISMAQKQVADPPTPLGTFRPDLPPWCESVISKALSKAPAARFQTAEEFRAALRAAVTPAPLGELPTMATPTAAGLLRTSDLTLPHPSGSVSAAPTITSDIRRTGLNPPSGASVAPVPG
nr:serine/threonine protein kinase [Acidobacteriota bacterium]